MVSHYSGADSRSLRRTFGQDNSVFGNRLGIQTRQQKSLILENDVIWERGWTHSSCTAF